MNVLPSLLWLIDPQPQFGLRHGAALRHFGLGGEWIARGGEAHFAFASAGPEADEASAAFLAEQCREGRASSVSVLRYAPTRWRRRLAHGLIHPVLTRRVLRAAQAEVLAQVEALLQRHRVDVVLAGDRRFLFLVTALAERVPVVVDWIDSNALHALREARHAWGRRAWGSLPGATWRLVHSALQERHYGRRAVAAFAASAVDRDVLARLAESRPGCQLVENGLHPAPGRVAAEVKQAGRLVFSGTMDYPPNHEAAVWFVDRVLPLVRRHRPEAHFVVAGQRPLPDLLRRAGPAVTVTGAVPDLRAELATGALFVAPLVSGSGFRNKVVEALAAGTFVAGTPLALEFLPERLRTQLLVGDGAGAFADRVLEFFAAPAVFEARLPALQAVLAAEYTWPRRADELRNVVTAAIARRPNRPVPAWGAAALAP
ncbi:MAG: glycosyltransferase [Vicinamibacteria bacterium]|nr:glycosyltransferase [Vicinamibacteria bacterium]